MTIEAKLLYLKKITLRYKKATKKEKGGLLTEAAEICDYSRKHIIRLINKGERVRADRRGRKPKYTIQDRYHLGLLWKLMRYMCSKRMVAAIPLWLEYYECPEEVKENLLIMSASTIDRILHSCRQDWKKGKSATKPGSYIKSRIPIELLTEKVKKPGFMEADTVVHCGNSLLGQFANTLTMTDLFTGWTENRATWSKESKEILVKIKEIRTAIPFEMCGFACDNGTEFINHNLVNYLSSRKNGYVKFVRRRPYKKNDNAHVEQKNNTHVRQLFGYSRLDCPDLVKLMNEIYADCWGPFNNYFCPVMKLKEKIRIGGRLKKVYDIPKTPYQRLIDSGTLTDLQRKNIEINMQNLNPIVLRKQLDDKMRLFQSVLTKNQKLGEAPSMISEEK